MSVSVALQVSKARVTCPAVSFQGIPKTLCRQSVPGYLLSTTDASKLLRGRQARVVRGRPMSIDADPATSETLGVRLTGACMHLEPNARAAQGHGGQI
jgi:hypothetical protein